MARAVIVSGVAQRSQSRPHFDQSSGSSPSSRISLSPGEAEDAERRAVEARFDPGRVGDGRTGAAHVVGEQPAAPLESGPVPVPVEPELVARGDDLGHELRVALDLLPADEEDG